MTVSTESAWLGSQVPSPPTHHLQQPAMTTAPHSSCKRADNAYGPVHHPALWCSKPNNQHPTWGCCKPTLYGLWIKSGWLIINNIGFTPLYNMTRNCKLPPVGKFKLVGIIFHYPFNFPPFVLTTLALLFFLTNVNPGSIHPKCRLINWGYHLSIMNSNRWHD